MIPNHALRESIINGIILDFNIMDTDEVRQNIQDSINKSIEKHWDSLSLAERCGPGLWDTLHWVAKVADEENKPDVYNTLLWVFLQAHPCKEECRPNLSNNLDNVSYSDTCFKHSFKLHNLVNSKLGKSTETSEAADKQYNIHCDSCYFKI